MPITHHSAKALRQARKRTLKNRQVKDTIRGLVRDIRQAVTTGNKAEAQKLMQTLQQRVDKAIKQKILKPNTGNRKKSRIATKIQAVK